mgnify:FL=1
MPDTTSSAVGVKRQQKVESLSRAERRERNRAVALDLAERGFTVVPVIIKRGAHKKIVKPVVAGWQERRAPPKEQIKREWDEHPDAVPALVTGINFDVIDLDRKDGKDGVAELESLGCSLDEFNFVVRSPSGGLHLYIPESGLRSRADLKPGIDTRGKGGFIIAPGAIDHRGEYGIEKGDLVDVAIEVLPEPPEALLRVVKPAKDERGTDAATPPEVPLWKLQDALSHIPPDLPHDDWVRALMGVHHATAGSDTGLSIALGWSAPYREFRKKEVEDKWLSFGKEREGNPAPVTVRTVLDMARSHGWRDREAEAEIDATWEDDLDDLDFILNGPPTPVMPGKRKHGFRLLTPDQCANLPPQPFLLEGLLGPQDVAAMVGQPGSGKSLLAPFIGYSIALGQPVFGRDVVQGRVLYLAAENERGLMDRVKALHQEFGNCEDFIAVAEVEDMRRSVKRLLELVNEERPALVVVDTFAAAFPGLRENEADEMSAAIAVLRKVQAAGPAVLVAAHGTKAGGNTLRGSGVADGALDVSLFIEHRGAKDRHVYATKNRNGPDGDTGIRFSVGTRVTGADHRGKAVETPICEPIEAEAESPNLTRNENRALALIDSLGRDGVPLAIYHEKAAEPGVVSDAADARDRKKKARAALDGLAAKRMIAVTDEAISIPSFDSSGDDGLWS